MSRNTASPHYDRESLYAPLRRADELPGHVITEELAELHNDTFWRGCQGESCRQGRAACTDRCDDSCTGEHMKTLMFYLSLYRLNRFGRSRIAALIQTFRPAPF